MQETESARSVLFDPKHEQGNLGSGTPPIDFDSKAAGYSEATDDEL